MFYIKCCTKLKNMLHRQQTSCLFGSRGHADSVSQAKLNTFASMTLPMIHNLNGLQSLKSSRRFKTAVHINHYEREIWNFRAALSCVLPGNPLKPNKFREFVKLMPRLTAPMSLCSFSTATEPVVTSKSQFVHTAVAVCDVQLKRYVI